MRFLMPCCRPLPLLLVSALLVSGCAKPETDARPDVLVLTIDTIRADAFGCYGSTKGLTPNLDALAARGVRFEQAFAPMATTFPSHSSMFTGLYPRAHGVRWNGDALGEEHLTLAELLQMRGYATGAFVAYKAMVARGGLKQGFDVVSDDTIVPGPKTHEQRIRTGAEVNRLAFEYLDGLDAEDDRPTFLWLHYFEPHSPYPMTDYARERLGDYEGHLADGADLDEFFDLNRPENQDPETARVMQDIYDGRVLDTDDLVGELLAGLEQRGRLDDTLLVVVGDHAQMLGNHGFYGHGPILWQEVLDVPFFIVDPRNPQPGVVEERVSVLDVMPTVLEMLGEEAPPGMQGRSLAPALQGEPLDPFVYFAEVRIADPRQAGAESQGDSVAAVDGPFKLVLEAESYQLFNLEEDPGEVRPMGLEEHPEVVAKLRPLVSFHQHMPPGSIADSGEMSQEMLEELQSLGYVDSDAGQEQ